MHFKKRDCLLAGSGLKGGEESRESGNKAISTEGTRIGGCALCVTCCFLGPLGLGCSVGVSWCH